MLTYPSLSEQDLSILDAFRHINVSYKNMDFNKEINFNVNKIGNCFLKVERASESFSVNKKLNFNEFYFYLYHSKINILVLKAVVLNGKKYYACEAYDDLDSALKVYGVMIRPMGNFKTTKALKFFLEKNITKIGIQNILADNSLEEDEVDDTNNDFKL